MKNWCKIVLLFSLVVSNFTFGQRDTTEGKIDDLGLDYRKLLDLEFTRIVTGQNTNFGSFAKVSTEDDIATLSGSLKVGSKSNLAITLKGGVTEGIIPLINGGATNPKISFGLQYNLGLYNLRKYTYVDGTKKLNFENSLDSLISIENRAEFELGQLPQKIALEISKAENKLEKKHESLRILEKAKSSENVLNNRRKDLMLDSINNQMRADTIEINELVYLVASLRKDSVRINSSNELSRRIQNLRESCDLAYSKIYSNVVLEGYRLNWWSFGLRLNNRTFNSFDNSLPFDDQVVKRRFNQFEIGTSWNIYNLVPDEAFKSYFLTLGAFFVLDDNFDELSSKTLVQKDSISTYPSERTISESMTVYLGEYKSKLEYWKVDADFYWFLNNTNSLAFHINPSLRTTFKAKPKIDTRLGLIIGVKNQEEAKNILNIEVFYNMTDMFKEGDINNEETFEDRTSFGINLNFPIIFNRKSK